MKLPGRNHLYRYIPNYLNNRKLPAVEQLVVRLRAISAPEEDAYQRDAMKNSRMYSDDKSQELNEGRFRTLMLEKFDGLEGAEIEGFEGKEIDYDTFYAEAPADVVSEVIKVVRSTQLLSLGEQKNFVPEPDSPSSAPAT